MWKIFSKKENNLESVLKSIDDWKKDLFNILERDVKEYFSQKVIVYFDNHMIFQPKRGLHTNLMDALSTAEEEMLHSNGLFNKIEMYWIRDENEHILMIFGLDDDKINTLEKYDFQLIQNNAVVVNDTKEKLEFNSWKTLVFDAELVNYSNGWISYVPNIENRSVLQAEYILLNTHLKKQDLNLLERIEFEKNIKNHPAYNELYNKVLRIMPKIGNSLEQEWKTGNLPEPVEENKPIKKKKI